jgi:anti-sigma factor RsiW
MRRKSLIEHLENPVILAYLDGELSRAAARKAKQHLQSCWKCRSAAAELEGLAQTAYTLLASRDDSDTAQIGTAKAEFVRRRAKFDTAWKDGAGHRTSLLGLGQIPSLRADYLRKAYSSFAV